MNRFLRFSFVWSGFFCFLLANAQISIDWAKKYGGTDHDNIAKLKKTNSGKYVFISSSVSDSVDATEAFGEEDLWMVVLDTSKNIIAQKTLGGSEGEIAENIFESNSGDFFISCSGETTHGDLVATNGLKDMVLIKGDSLGGLLWQKTYGSSAIDAVKNSIYTSDDHILMVGYSGAGDSTVSTFYGGEEDIWIVKVDTNGVLAWEKSFGGSLEEIGYSIIENAKGNYVVVASTASSDGTFSSNIGGMDLWVAELDASNGSIIWEKSYGGSANEVPTAIISTKDNGYLVASYTESSDGDISLNKGEWDVWLLKLDSTGVIAWSKTYGGALSEFPRSIIELTNGDVLISAYSFSSDGDLSINKGMGDVWILRLNEFGGILSQKSIGGTQNDVPANILQVSDFDEYVIGVNSMSSDGDFSSNYGEFDAWLVGFKLEKNTLANIIKGDSVVCDNSLNDVHVYSAIPNSNNTISWNISPGGQLLSHVGDSVEVTWSDTTGQYLQFIQIDNTTLVADTATLDVSIIPANNIFLTDSIFPGDSILFGSTIIRYPGEYTYTSAAQEGCDTIYTISVKQKDLLTGQCSELFISELYDGGSASDLVEIYNPTNVIIDLSDYKLKIYPTTIAGSNNQALRTIPLVGSINPNSVHVVGSSFATILNPQLASLADQLHNELIYNGYQTVVLEKNNFIVDMFGKKGYNPSIISGGGWIGDNGIGTNNKSVIRKVEIEKGSEPNLSQIFSPSNEWKVIQLSTDFIGDHSSACNGCLDNDSIIFKTICLGDSVLFEGEWKKSGGVFAQKKSSSGDCDSLLILQLSIDSNCTYLSTEIYGDTSLCSGIKDTLTYIAQYDSNSTIVWDVHLGSVVSQNGDSVQIVWDDTIGQMLQVIQTDSILLVSDTAILLINTSPAYVNSFSDSIVSGDTLYIGSAVITTPGVYIDSLLSINGCDSITVVTVTQKNLLVSCDGLFISEYVEGNSNNNAIEIYNGSQQTVDLTNYRLKIYANGSTQASYTIPLTGLIGAVSTHLLVHASATNDLQNLADQIVPDLTFNGNDAIVLEENGVAIDIFGAVGNNPGISWSGGGVSTLNHTLVRKPLVSKGVHVNPTTFDPSIEWEKFSVDHFTGLGWHIAVCQGCPTSNEVSVVLNICQSDSAFLGGSWVTSPGLYVDSLLTPINCDSIVKTQLNFVTTINSTLIDSVCTGKPYDIAGQTLTGSGTYTINTTAAAGCDSVITLTLYEKACGVGIVDQSDRNGISIYPNPTEGGQMITIELPENFQLINGNVEVYDLQHKRVLVESISSTKRIEGAFAKGVYTVKITSSNLSKPITQKLLVY